MSVTGTNIIGALKCWKTYTRNLDYVMQILYMIESRQNKKTNMEQKMLQILPFICSNR